MRAYYYLVATTAIVNASFSNKFIESVYNTSTNSHPNKCADYMLPEPIN